MISPQAVVDVWARIEWHSGETFHAKSGLPFTYEIAGIYLRVVRNGARVNRSLSRTSFAKPVDLTPAGGTGY